METSNHIQIAGAFEPLFSLAADIARWPDILPHYRWVKVLRREGNHVIAEMAARHKRIPLWWRTIQRSKPEDKRIEFTHIGGITKGMEVEWTFTPIQEGWRIQIHHRFDPPWPLLGPWIAEKIIGQMFVEQIAGKTLGCIKKIVEGSPSPPPSPLEGKGVRVRGLGIS